MLKLSERLTESLIREYGDEYPQHIPSDEHSKGLKEVLVVLINDLEDLGYDKEAGIIEEVLEGINSKEITTTQVGWYLYDLITGDY